MGEFPSAPHAEWRAHHCPRPDCRTEEWHEGDLWYCGQCGEWYVVVARQGETFGWRKHWRTPRLRDLRRIKRIERSWR